MCNDTRCWVALRSQYCAALCLAVVYCRGSSAAIPLPFLPDEVKDDVSQFASHASLAATSAYCAMAACNVALYLSLKCHVATFLRVEEMLTSVLRQVQSQSLKCHENFYITLLLQDGSMLSVLTSVLQKPLVKILIYWHATC